VPSQLNDLPLTYCRLGGTNHFACPLPALPNVCTSRSSYIPECNYPPPSPPPSPPSFGASPPPIERARKTGTMYIQYCCRKDFGGSCGLPSPSLPPLAFAASCCAFAAWCGRKAASCTRPIGRGPSEG